MTTCYLCGGESVQLENFEYSVNPITGQRHGYNICIIKIPRFDTIGNVALYRRPESVAHDIVNKCIAAGKDPNRVRVERSGDYLLIR